MLNTFEGIEKKRQHSFNWNLSSLNLFFHDVFPQAHGLSFDFVTRDPSIYLVSTEDGIIHKCSVSYNEQYLETFTGHSAPVYKVRASPFCPNAFLSCGGDWMVKLWNIKETKALYTFQSSDLSAAVNDVVWSPYSSTLFGSVTGDGRIMLYDLSLSAIDPIVVYERNPRPPTVPAPLPPADSTYRRIVMMDLPESSMDEIFDESKTDLPAVSTSTTPAIVATRPEYTSLLFCKETPIIMVGDSCGIVSCFRMTNVTDIGVEKEIPFEVQEAKLLRSMDCRYAPRQ